MQYAVKSQLIWHGLDPATAMIELEPRPGEALFRTEDITAAIAAAGPELALVLFPGVQYYTGQAFDVSWWSPSLLALNRTLGLRVQMPAITAAGHAAGAIVGFDLAHAAGVYPDRRLHNS